MSLNKKTDIVLELSDQMNILMGDTPINLNSPEQLSQYYTVEKLLIKRYGAKNCFNKLG